MENANSLPNISPEKKEELIKLAASKLGKSESELKGIMESGKLDSLMGKMSESQKDGLQKLINDPKKLEGAMNSPMVRKLLNDYLSKK